jgi:hypothetical protein
MTRRWWWFSAGIILLIFIIVSCQKLEVEIVYKIPAGDHSCSPRVMQSAGNILEFEVYTHPSWRYDPEYTNGWSKITGLGHLDHRQNSARIGWMSNGDSIKVCGYFYLEGNRITRELGKLAYGQWYSGMIQFFDDSYTIVFNDRRVSVSGYSRSRNYIKNPYFGGTEPAPHEMVFPFRNVYTKGID